MPTVQRAMVLAMVSALSCSPAAHAQPAASFLATCAELRSKAATLDLTGDPLITIEVEGRIVEIEETGALVYVTVCAKPEPKVVCATYSRDGRKVGDVVVLAGAYYRRGADLVILDPCLHHTR